jgi:ankyrin repeat protein
VAASIGDMNVIELLAKAGAKLNVKWSDFNYTPLHLSSLVGNLDATALLIKLGADPHLKDAEGFETWQLTERAEIVDLTANPQEKLLWYARDLWYGQV